MLINIVILMCAAVYAFAQYSRYDQRQMLKVIAHFSCQITEGCSVPDSFQLTRMVFSFFLFLLIY